MADKKINRQLSIFINDKQVINSLSGLSRAINHTKNAMNALDSESDDYDESLKKLQSQLKKLKDQQEDLKEEIYGTEEAMGAAKAAFANLSGGLQTGNLAMAAVGWKTIRSAIIATTKATLAFIATPIGATIAVLAGIALAAKEWYDYNKEISKAKVTTEAITKLSGDVLDSTRLRAKAIAETFDKDFAEILETAKSLVTAFDITYEEALSRIENGLVKGGHANEEYLESLREYPTFFAQAKYSVEEFQNLVNAGIDVGIYKDKLPDAIKEFVLAITEQTPAAREALQNAFGEEFTNRLLKGVKDGTISVKQALEQVSAEAERTGLNMQQAQLLTADLFKGAGEDAGGAIKIFEAVSRSIENQKRPLTEVEQAMQDLADSQRDLTEAQDKFLNSEGFSIWEKNVKQSLNSIATGFYKFMYTMTNSSDRVAKDALAEVYKVEQEEIDAFVADTESSFKRYIERQKKFQKDRFNLEEATNVYLATLRESAKNSEDEGYKQLIDLSIKHLEEKKAINNKNSLEEIKARAAANKKRSDELKRQQEQERKDAKRAAEQALKDFLKDQVALAKATVDAYIIANASKIDKDKALTQEIIAEEEKRLQAISEKQLELIRIDKQTNDSIIAGKKITGQMLTAADVEYLNEKKKLELANVAEIDALKKQYAEEQKALRAEQLLADNELELAEAENAHEEARIREEQEYAESVERYKQMYTDKKITAEEYFRFMEALDKKRIAAERLRDIVKAEEQLNEMGKLADAAVEMFGQSKAAAIATASINAGLAVTEILKTPSVFPEPMASISRAIQIGGIVAKTGKAISQINSSKAPKRAKFFYGGYTGNKAIDRDEFGAVTGTVHEDEWVAPAAMTQNPRYANVIGWLENERQKLPGYYNGGPTSPGAVVPAAPASVIHDTDINLIIAINRLNSNLENGITAKTVFGYQDLENLNTMNDELKASGQNGILP